MKNRDGFIHRILYARSTDPSPDSNSLDRHRFDTPIVRPVEASERIRWDEEMRAQHSKLLFVYSDRWHPCLAVIAKKGPEEMNILDRFHIMKKFGEAIDHVPRTESVKAEGKEAVFLLNVATELSGL